MEKCIVFASVGGLCASAASNVIALANDRASKSNKKMGFCANLILLLANLILNFGSVGCFLLSVAHGPVSVAMPLVTASKLLSSMWFQLACGLGQYTKNVRVGTYVLVASSLCLIDCGPKDPIGPEPNVMEMLSATTAKCWLLFLVVTLIISMASYHLLALRTNGQQKYGLVPVCAVVAISTALGASVGKTLSLTEGTRLEVAVCAYLICGVASFLYAAKGAFNYEIELFLPLSEVLQLLVNALTGVLVWGDLSRTPQQLSYAMVYILICLGIYDCMSYDLLARKRKVGVFGLLHAANKVIGAQRIVKLFKWVGNKGTAKENINKILTDGQFENLGENLKTNLSSMLSNVEFADREAYLLDLCKELTNISHELFNKLPLDQTADQSVVKMQKRLINVSEELPSPKKTDPQGSLRKKACQTSNHIQTECFELPSG